jgi:Transposase IS66 family
MEDMFNERMSPTTIVAFITTFAREYRGTEKLFIGRLMQSPFVHVDETRLNIEGAEYYVWIFTDGDHVVFRMTETREARIVHEFLKGYRGVLVSASAASSPPARPHSSIANRSRNTTPITARRPAPSAMRMPISLVRRLTE